MRHVIKSEEDPSFGAGASARRYSAFTLVELLVATAVLALLLVMTAQMVGHTMSATTASNRQMDSSSMARIVLDRMTRDFSSAVLNGGATALYYHGSTDPAPDPKLNSAIGFVCKSRARKHALKTVVDDVRGLVVGYKMRNLQVKIAPGTSPNVPLIHRGDAVFTFLNAKTGKASGGDNYGSSVWSMFGNGSDRPMPSDLTIGASDERLLDWQGFGDGVLRFHISFVLSDGHTVQIPPAYLNFQSNGGTGDCIPIAFSADTSADANKRYVKGLIIGIVVLDESSLRLGYLRDNKYAETLANQLKRPVSDGETPVGIWQANLGNIDFPPVRQNIRFYQRFCPVNL